jgi:hypothetical protein
MEIVTDMEIGMNMEGDMKIKIDMDMETWT